MIQAGELSATLPRWLVFKVGGPRCCTVPDPEGSPVPGRALSKQERSKAGPDKRTSGAKARADFVGLMRGLKPPPPSGALIDFSKSNRGSFGSAQDDSILEEGAGFERDFAALVDFQDGVTARLKSCPDTKPALILRHFWHG
jgi:hypothetical protein